MTESIKSPSQVGFLLQYSTCVPGEQAGRAHETETSLPRDALVIRGGTDMTPMHLSDRCQAFATRCEENGLPAQHALSVNCIPGLTLDELAARAGLLHPKIRVSTIGQIDDAGWVVAPT